jgi:hypothetical protein
MQSYLSALVVATALSRVSKSGAVARQTYLGSPLQWAGASKMASSNPLLKRTPALISSVHSASLDT